MKHGVLIGIIIMIFASCADNEPMLVNSNELQTELTTIDRDWPSDVYEEVTLANGQTVYVDSDGTYFLDDIVFSEEQIEIMNTPQQRAAVRTPFVWYWPNKVIRYNIRPGFSTKEIGYITSALNILENTICIDFVPGGVSSNYCIFFYPNTLRNASPVGMNTSTRNTIELYSDGFDTATVIHEVMHSLGFFHEQSRNDRDDYVVIYEENIMENKERNFAKIVDIPEYDGTSLGPFDYNSIMIYDSYEFTGNNNVTITKLDGSTIPRNTSLSYYDIRGLNYIYGPKPVLTTTEEYSHISNDMNSIDETIRYSNIVTFKDMSGQPIALTYPKLLIVDHHLTTHIGPLDINRETSTTVRYYEVPAGATQYELPDSEYIRQEDLGINRYYKEEHYSVRIY